MDVLIDELFNEKRLRQGWGYEFDGINLNLKLSEEEWIENFIQLRYRLRNENVECEKANGRWDILKDMKYIKKGDIIFIPNIPDEDNFTISTAENGYNFETLDDFCNFGH